MEVFNKIALMYGDIKNGGTYELWYMARFHLFNHESPTRQNIEGATLPSMGSPGW